ncbi:hypothetical protein V8G54_008598 [Vigna mungo]|uniref:Transmembrane protein n=1 Tax=Vigna mungo TaxID=3915 RepID=A0AAQ3P5G5_VIGMU
MASRYRSVSQPALSFIKSTITKPASKPTPSAFLLKTRSPVTARQDCFPYEVIPFLRPNWILCLFCASSFFFVQVGGWGAWLPAVAASAALGGVVGAPHFLSRHRFE